MVREGRLLAQIRGTYCRKDPLIKEGIAATKILSDEGIKTSIYSLLPSIPSTVGCKKRMQHIYLHF